MLKSERRFRRNNKIAKRRRLAEDLGLQQGILYKRHRDKLKISWGYLSKGNVRHYVSVFPRRYYKRESLSSIIKSVDI